MHAVYICATLHTMAVPVYFFQAGSAFIVKALSYHTVSDHDENIFAWQEQCAVTNSFVPVQAV